MDDKPYEMYVEDNVVVANFPPDMEVEEELFEQINEEFAELTKTHGVNTHITILDVDSPMGRAIFEKGKEAARMGLENGVNRWIAVADPILRRALVSKLEEVEGVHAEHVEKVEEAWEIAKEEEDNTDLNNQ